MNAPTSYTLKRLEASFQDEKSLIQSTCSTAVNRKRQPFFVQIGANDGVSDDFLHDILKENPHWKGVLVEPHTASYEALKATYQEKSTRYQFANVAISNSNGEGILYHVSPEFIAERVTIRAEKGKWLERIASLSKEHFSHIKFIDLADHIVEQKVKLVTWKSFVKQHSIKYVDALFIDTEGHDLQILKQVDLTNQSPTLIVYEHRHLKVWQQASAEQLLLEKGYELRVFAFDTVATLPLPQ
jgi:FkbM family methyltransferase